MVLFMLSATAQPAVSQPCKVGVQAAPIGFWTWAPASHIYVYVREHDFDATERSFLLAPLETWNAVSEATGSKVKFEYRGTTTSSLHCENCLTIRRGAVFDKSRRHLSELRTYSQKRDRIMTWGDIFIDPRLTNSESLTNAVAHELGHSFGLLDCYSCKERSTVMLQFKRVNVPNQMEGPSACDVAQVKAIYQAVAVELSRRPRPKPIVVDEGEDAIEDDTPVVIPKP